MARVLHTTRIGNVESIICVINNVDGKFFRFFLWKVGGKVATPSILLSLYSTLILSG